MVFSLYKEETKAKRSFWIIVIVEYIWEPFYQNRLRKLFPAIVSYSRVV